MNQVGEVAPLVKRSEMTGAALVRIIVIALVLLLTADRFGWHISLLHFVIAAGLAAILYFLGSNAFRWISRLS
jgi:hypothetical protein